MGIGLLTVECRRPIAISLERQRAEDGTFNHHHAEPMAAVDDRQFALGALIKIVHDHRHQNETRPQQ